MRRTDRHGGKLQWSQFSHLYGEDEAHGKHTARAKDAGHVQFVDDIQPNIRPPMPRGTIRRNRPALAVSGHMSLSMPPFSPPLLFFRAEWFALGHG
jgi:hypothetical protein